MDEIENQIKQRIMTEFLPQHQSHQLGESTALISGGILDSVKILQLVTVLEETFGISVEAHEVNTENFDTIKDIANFVRNKRSH